MVCVCVVFLERSKFSSEVKRAQDILVAGK